MNPGEKLKKKDVNNDLSHFMSVFPTLDKEQIFIIIDSYFQDTLKQEYVHEQ